MSLLVISLLLGLHETAYCKSKKNPANDSNIRYENGKCRFQNPDKIDLKDIGLSEHDIEADSVGCIMADFDGNGYYDFAFWGKFDAEAFWGAEPDSNARYELERRFKVIFFEKDRIISTQIIRNHARDHLLLYGPTDKEGEFGEPKTDLPGLVQWGEGGTTYIYLYDPKTRQLERSSYASEWL